MRVFYISPSAFCAIIPFLFAMKRNTMRPNSPYHLNKQLPARLYTSDGDIIALPTSLTGTLLGTLELLGITPDTSGYLVLDDGTHLTPTRFPADALLTLLTQAKLDKTLLTTIGAALKGDEPDVTVLFEQAYLTPPPMAEFAVWDRDDAYWLIPDQIAANGNGTLFIDGQPRPEHDTRYALHRYTGMTADNGKRLQEGHIVHWGHRAPHTECVPRKAVVVFHPVKGLSFHTFNLGKNDHLFAIGNFAYKNVLDEAMTIIGHVRDKASTFPLAHRAFRYFDRPSD
jgi:hypothetical protein